MAYLLSIILFLASQESNVKMQGYTVTEFPSKQGEPVEYIIITTDKLKPAFEKLRDWKREKGINSVIRTVNWINTNYPGCDLPERIRNFLRESYYEWGTQWVLMGGDITDVPARRVRSINHYAGYYELLTDMYYACLNGSWNANGNEGWGEVHLDSTDYDIHLWVGRLLGATLQEIETGIDKILKVEKEPWYENKLLLIAGALWSGGLQSAEHCREIAKCFPDYFQIDSLFEKDSTARGCVLTKQAVLDSLEQGYSYVYLVSHGSQTQDFAHPISIGRKDIDGLNNPPFFMTDVSCYVNWVDVDCISRHFMLNPNGGSSAFRGSSRVGWDAQEEELNTHFYCNCGLFDKDSTAEIGKLDAYAKQKIEQSIGSGKDAKNNYRDAFLSYILLGDPELRLWRNIPETLMVEVPEIVDIGEEEIQVVVRNQSLEPLSNTRVCISREDEVYAKGFTNQNGEITFILCSEAPGVLKIVATHQDFLPYEKHIFVNPTKPFVRYKSHFVTAPPEGGKVFTLYLSLENTGATVASNVRAKLLPNSSLVALSGDSIQYYGNIVAGENKTMKYKGRIALMSPPEEVIFYITSSYTEGTSEDAFNLTLIAPELTHHSHFLDKDSIMEGVPTKLSFRVKNSGNNKASKVIARLLSLNPEISVTDSTEEIDSIPALKIETYQNCFTFVASAPVNEPGFILELKDSVGREWADTFCIKFPNPPEELFSYTKPYGISISWNPVTDSIGVEVYGYNVYRLPDSLPLNSDLITGLPTFTDREVGGFDGYLYVVTGVDSDLNESKCSPRVYGRANPDFKPGWPQSGLGISTCFNNTTPAVGDLIPSVNGLEVVANGGDELYAWHSNGEGVISFNGLFVENLGGAWNSPAMGDIDNNGTLEIARIQSFAGDGGLYVFRQDGTPAPGFPVQLVGDWGSFTSPTLQDLDGDSLLEIIAVGSSSGWVYVFREDGTGFLNPDGTFGKMEDGHTFGAPGVADIDGDDTLEIITAGTDWIYAWKPNGELLPNWPAKTLGKPSSPAIGDLDPSYPGLEVAVYTSQRQLYVFHADGTIFWKKYCSAGGKLTRMSHPAIGDIDGDGILEIALSGENKLYLWNHDGTSVNTEEIFIPMMDIVSRASTVIGDVDGDGSHEIIVTTLNEGNIYAIEQDGTIAKGFPIIANGLIDGTPTIADIDLDGKHELIVGTNTQDVRVWGISGNKVEWGTFAHDRWRTGLYGFAPPDTIPAAVEEKPEVFCFRLFQNAPNPFRQITSIKYQIPSKSKVSLKIYDVAGRLVQTLVNEEFAKGDYTTKWEGKNAFGNKVARGIYFYRLKTGKFTASKKLILM